MTKKKFKITLLIFVFLSLIAYIYVANSYQNPNSPNYCGTWGPLVGGEPTCECDGEIIETGGPSGPADDSGGYYKCNGNVISNKK